MGKTKVGVCGNKDQLINKLVNLPLPIKRSIYENICHENSDVRRKKIMRNRSKINNVIANQPIKAYSILKQSAKTLLYYYRNEYVCEGKRCERTLEEIVNEKQ